MERNDRFAGELAAAAVAVMTVWADDPGDGDRLRALLADLGELDVCDASGVVVSGVSLGLANLCGLLLVEFAEVLGWEPADVLSACGEGFARVAAGVELPAEPQ